MANTSTWILVCISLGLPVEIHNIPMIEAKANVQEIMLTHTKALATFIFVSESISILCCQQVISLCKSFYMFYFTIISSIIGEDKPPSYSCASLNAAIASSFVSNLAILLLDTSHEIKAKGTILSPCLTSFAK